ncbi:MAG: alpha-mannosidase [Fimbriimonadaceae bacterium]|nr:alpha-mannosidase [Fimbriimonadaceae bacterium]
MLKHPDLTRRRIAQFLEHQLKPSVYGERVSLDLAYDGEAHPDEAHARKGAYTAVAPGFEWGPAYREAWFRVKGRVPEDWAGRAVGLHVRVGAEATAWADNSPVRGIDGPHDVWPILREAAGGEALERYVQAYAGNPEHRVHLRELPRRPLVATVEGAELVEIREGVKALYYDVAFAQSLLGALKEDTPEFHIVLRGLNEVCNVWAIDGIAAAATGRKIVRDALGQLTADVRHTLTPVGHAHLDTAWLWPIRVTKLKMAHTTATQLDLISQYPEYVFVHSQAAQYEWLEKEYPVLFERVKAAIAAGQWEPVGSMWIEADCNLTGAESLVRQFLYGRKYFRDKLGYQTEDMWLPDVFGYSAALPQILGKFGIRYFLTQKISWNQLNKFPHHTFWWQGIDGTKVWSHFPPADTYCGNGEPAELLRSVSNFKDHARSGQSLYVFGFGDGGGGPTEQHLEFLRRARKVSNLPDVEGSKTALSFFEEAKAKSRDLATWVGELYLELHRGTYTSQAANKKMNRVTEFLLRDAEWLAAFADRPYPAEDLEAAWKLVLLNQFHDIIPGSSVNEVYVDSAADYRTVVEIGERVVGDSLRAIAARLDTAGYERPVALFQNAGIVTQGAIDWEGGETPSSLRVGDEALPVQLVEEFGESKLVFATPSSVLGAVQVGDLGSAPPNVKARLRASGRRLENDELSIRFDANGNLTSVQSLGDGREYVQPDRPANVFQLFDDKPLFWSAWDIDVFAYETCRELLKAESFEVVEKGPVRVAAEVVRRFGNSRIRQRISLGPTPGVRFDTEIDWHEEDKLLKVAFPLNVNASRATYEIQFGHVERPTHTNTSWDLAKFEVCAQKWVDVSEGDQGVALLNDGKYGHDAQGNTIRLSLLRAPKAPDPECDMGRHRFTYVLLPHVGTLPYSNVVQAAYALNAPLRSVRLTPQKGLAAALPPFVSCDNPNLVIEAVKKAEAGDDLIVRLYECHNSRGNGELASARPIRSAWLCDLEENPIMELETVDGLAMFAYRPFEILTVRIAV